MKSNFNQVKPKWCRNEVKVISKWHQSEFEVNFDVASAWNRNEFELVSNSTEEKPKWTRSELEVRSTWSLSDFEVTSESRLSEIEVRSKCSRSETEVSSKWNRSEVASSWNRSIEVFEMTPKWNRVEKCHRSEVEGKSKFPPLHLRQTSYRTRGGVIHIHTFLPGGAATRWLLTPS